MSKQTKTILNIGIITHKNNKPRLGVIRKGLFVVPTYHGRDLRLVGTCQLEPYGACFIYDQGQISRHIDTRKDSKTLSWHIYVPMDQKQDIKALFNEH